MKAHANKDYTKFVALNQEALQLHPSQPTIMYNLAAGYSLIDSIKNTYISLKRLLSWNSTIAYKKDADFGNFLLSTKYASSLDSLVEHYGAVKNVGVDFVNFEGKRHLEDLILVDTLLFVSDFYNGELIKYNIEEREFSIVKEFDLPVLALASKPNSASIWVSTAKMSQSRKKGSQSSTPEIVEIDILTGETKSRIPLEDDFIAGSMVFDKKDNLYISNSTKPEIIVIDTRANTIVQSLALDGGFNLQGITIDLDKDILYVSDYIRGIASIDIAKNYEINWLKSNYFLVKGVDGLTFVKENQLLGIQNNSTPKRVIKLTIKDSEIEKVSLLDNNLNTTGEPTNGRYYDKLGYLYISNSSWPHYDKNGKPIFEDWEEQKILRIKPGSFLE